MSLFVDCTSLCAHSPLVHTSPVASLSAESTDDDDDLLPTATPTYTRHSSHSVHHTFSHVHSPTHSFVNLPPESTIGLTSPHDSLPFNPPSSHAHKSMTIIIFASIGGVIGLFFLALFTRRAIVHSRLPRHNVALTESVRAQIEQEIVECTEFASRRQRQSLTAPPPPPYEHAPSYDPMMPHRLS